MPFRSLLEKRSPAELRAGLLRDYSTAAHDLEADQLVFLYGYNLLMAEKIPDWEDRVERRQILGKELVIRGVNPYFLTVDEYRVVFNRKDSEWMGATRNLLGRARGMMSRPYTV